MKKILVLPILVIVILFSGCAGSRILSPKYITIPESNQYEKYTNDQLKNLIKQTQSPSVIVRSMNSGNSEVSAASNTSQIISILEMALAKNGLDVRDRALFENVIRSLNMNNTQSLDYRKLYEQTEVDLLMEISEFSTADWYKVDKYWSNYQYHYFPKTTKLVNGKKVDYHPEYYFQGMSISIRVVILKDNLIGGSYRYTYVPCSEESGGALISNLSPLIYYPPNESRDISAVLRDDNESGLLESRSKKLDRAMESFVTQVAIPQMLADMRGQVFEKPKAWQTISERKNDEQTKSKINIISTTTEQIYDNKEVIQVEELENKSIISVNSFDKLAPAVSSLVELKITEQEKPKKLLTLKTDLARLRAIKKEAMTDIRKFISTSTSRVEGNLPNEHRTVMFHLSYNPEQQQSDNGLILFIDEKCVGVGTVNKGLYAAFPLDLYPSGFHTVTLTSETGVVIFNSSVDFSIKDKFNFQRSKKKILLSN